MTLVPVNNKQENGSDYCCYNCSWYEDAVKYIGLCINDECAHYHHAIGCWHQPCSMFDRVEKKS